MILLKIRKFVGTFGQDAKCKIPGSIDTKLDPRLQLCRIEIRSKETGKTESVSPDVAPFTDILINETFTAVNYFILGNKDFYLAEDPNKDGSYQKLPDKYLTITKGNNQTTELIEFSEERLTHVNAKLENAEKYEVTILLPYPNPMLDVLTQTTLESNQNGSKTEDVLIATTF